MRLIRDIDGIDLAKRLNRYGYLITRQTGSTIANLHSDQQ